MHRHAEPLPLLTALPHIGPLEEFYITLPELPAHEVVLQHVSSNAPQRTDPRWARAVAILGGLLLIGAGVFLAAIGAWMEFRL
jgi:hypothetical protein